MIKTNKKILIPIILIIMILTTINVYAYYTDMTNFYYMDDYISVQTYPNEYVYNVEYFPATSDYVMFATDYIYVRSLDDFSDFNTSTIATYDANGFVFHSINTNGLSGYRFISSTNSSLARIEKYELAGYLNFSTMTNTENFTNVENFSSSSFVDFEMKSDESEYLLVRTGDDIEQYGIGSSTPIATIFYSDHSFDDQYISEVDYDPYFNAVIVSGDRFVNNFIWYFDFGTSTEYDYANAENVYAIYPEKIGGDLINSNKKFTYLGDSYFGFLDRTTTPTNRLYIYNINATPYPPVFNNDYLDIYMFLNSELQINLNDELENYDSVNYSFYDTSEESYINLSTSKGGSNSSYDTAYINVELIPESDKIYLRYTSKDTALQFNGLINATNIYGSDTLNTTINFTSVQLVTKAGLMTDLIMGYNSSITRNINNYYSGYDNITITFYDNCTSQNITLSTKINGATRTHESSCFKIQLIPTTTNVNLKIESKTTDYTGTMRFYASKTYGGYFSAVSDTPNFIINSSYISEVSNEIGESSEINNFLQSIFPDADTLNNGEKLLRVIATMFLTLVLLVVLGYEAGGIKILTFIGAIITLLELFYFSYIGYIGIGILIIIGVIAGGIIYFLVSSKTTGGQ